MNDHSTFSGCLISLLSNAGFSTFDILDQKCVGSSITLGILGTLAHFRHFSGLSGLGETIDLRGKLLYIAEKTVKRQLLSSLTGVPYAGRIP